MLNHGLLFQVYGEGAAWQFLGWILVFGCLVLANEIARRTKVGGMLCFVVLPIILTVYFIAIYVSAAGAPLPGRFLLFSAPAKSWPAPGRRR